MKRHVFAVPLYGEAPYLKELLTSLLNDRERSEIILTTSSPSDEFLMISREYSLPLFVREGRSSLKDDWNFAYEKALERGDLVTLAHQDDYYYPDYTTELFRAYFKYPDMSLFFSDYVTMDENGKLFRRPQEDIKMLLRIPYRFKCLSDRKIIKKLPLCLGNSVACPSVSYNASYIEPPLFRKDLKFVIDWDRLISFSETEGRFVCTEKPLLAYRIHKGQETQRTIKNHIREREEEEIFTGLYGQRMAGLIMKLYKRSYK